MDLKIVLLIICPEWLSYFFRASMQTIDIHEIRITIKKIIGSLYQTDLLSTSYMEFKMKLHKGLSFASDFQIDINDSRVIA